MIHSPERVKAIRERAAADLQVVAHLAAQTDDPGVHQRLQLIRHQLEDIELFFLASLVREPRTPQNESEWLAQAEKVLDEYIAPQLRDVRNAFAKNGPTIT
jgi:hypothetical protein